MDWTSLGRAVELPNCQPQPAFGVLLLLRVALTLWGATTPSPSAEMSFFGFGQSAELELVLSDAESRRRAEHKTEEGKKEKYFLFYDGETVSGRVILTLKHPNKRLEHQGIKVEFIGQIGKRDGEACP